MNLTEQQKEVLHHAIDNGWGTVEGRDFGSYWQAINMFSWSCIFTGKVELRIKQVPDSINWEHVSRGICGIARDEDGKCYGYTTIPEAITDSWVEVNHPTVCTYMNYFASYKQGTVDWKDSWVPNPFHKDNQVIGDN